MNTIHRLATCMLLSSVVNISVMPATDARAAQYFCTSGNVTCLIAAINSANGLFGDHVIQLEPGIYTLQAIDNTIDSGNGLPTISSSIRIEASGDNAPTVIERNPAATNLFRIFHVSASGKLTLDGVTVQRGRIVPFGGSAILNRGGTSIVDSIITNNEGEVGAINNLGTLTLSRSIIVDNSTGHLGGGIHNAPAANLLVQNSTLAHNSSTDGAGIYNEGLAVVTNSAIMFNETDFTQPGGGILNRATGFMEIINTTIAKNVGGDHGGGIANLLGHVSITNSTIRENVGDDGGGIFNSGGGTVQVKNTVIAGNTFQHSQFGTARDCSGNVTSLGNNLIGDPANCAITLQPSDLTGDPGLDSLVGAGEEDSPGRAYYPVLPGSAVINRGDPAACAQTDQLGNPRIDTCDIGAVEFQGPIPVAIDIRPHSDANGINPNSNQSVNVAILGGVALDTTKIVRNSVRFGPTGTEASGVQIALGDVNSDGYRDLLLRFHVKNSGIQCGDTSVSLTGKISEGFSIIGSTRITTVGCKRR
jgi:hypothetical protein